eukprot:2669468-Rhodomonas_salina.2
MDCSGNVPAMGSMKFEFTGLSSQIMLLPHVVPSCAFPSILQGLRCDATGEGGTIVVRLSVLERGVASLAGRKPITVVDARISLENGTRRQAAALQSAERDHCEQHGWDSAPSINSAG